MPEIRIEDVNAGVLSAPASFVLEAEKKYKDKVESLAERVVGCGSIRCVLISGPSGSGKTTTAALLAARLRERGREVLVVSLDDFYLDKTAPDYPRHEDGTLDFESPYALDLEFVRNTLRDIAAGESFDLPSFDFKTSSRDGIQRHSPMKGGVVIIEGLHALNPLINASTPPSAMLKVFISVSTNITEGGERIISGRKLRFLRRLVRDSIYRATSAESTLRLWLKVVDGEAKYLYPTRVHADVELDTFHDYELSLMRPFAEALITDAVSSQSEIAAVAVAAARRAQPLELKYLPKDSLMREFVP